MSTHSSVGETHSEVHSVWVNTKRGVRTLMFESYGERFDTLREALDDARKIEAGLEASVNKQA